MSLNQVSSKMRDIVQRIGNLQKELAEWEHEIPEYSELRNKEVLITSYSDVTQHQLEITKLLAEISTVVILIKDLEIRLKKGDFQDLTPALKAQYQGQITSSLKMLSEHKSDLMQVKGGVEDVLRFYNSVQYVLGSPRMNAFGE